MHLNWLFCFVQRLGFRCEKRSIQIIFSFIINPIRCIVLHDQWAKLLPACQAPHKLSTSRYCALPNWWQYRNISSTNWSKVRADSLVMSPSTPSSCLYFTSVKLWKQLNRKKEKWVKKKDERKKMIVHSYLSLVHDRDHFSRITLHILSQHLQTNPSILCNIMSFHVENSSFFLFSLYLSLCLGLCPLTSTKHDESFYWWELLEWCLM